MLRGVPRLRVAVVGAGLAGLSAARRLAAAGAEVRIFDKGRGPGGRASTRRSDGGAFDHGAQYFTCRDPEFEEIVSGWLASGVAATWQGRVVGLERGRCGDPSESTQRYVGVPGMSALGRELARGLDLACSCRIESAERDQAAWRLRAEGGGEIGPFDRVIVAVPAPQAVPLLAGAPALAAAVSAVEMEPCWAALIAFEKRAPADFDGAFVSESPLSWVARNASKPGRGPEECWVLHATPAWTRAHIEASRQEAAQVLLQSFAEALAAELPTAPYRDAHLWRYASTSAPLGQPYLFDATSGVGVCGDWGDGGRVERAAMSGDGLARAVLEDAPVGTA